VNRAGQGKWTVTGGNGNAVELPPSGWLVVNPGNEFREFSALLNGRRIDYVTSEAYEYLDGRGAWTTEGRLGATGGLVRRDRAPGGIELINLYGNDRIAVQAKGAGELMAYAPAGKNLGKVELSSLRTGWYEFKPVPGGRKYVFAGTH